MNFDYLALVFFGLFGLVVAHFAYRIYRHGGLRGALFGARVAQTIGELELGRRGMTRLRLKVHRPEATEPGSPRIGIELTSSSIAGAGMVPIALTTEQAQMLAAVLLDAARV